MRFINLTPHTLNVFDEEGKAQVAEIPPSGTVARVDTVYKGVGTVDNIPLFESVYGEVKNLPTPDGETMYIVSTPLRLACPERGDLASPGELLRNDEGQPIGCKGLVIRT
jgi:hypothetical protein